MNPRSYFIICMLLIANLLQLKSQNFAVMIQSDANGFPSTVLVSRLGTGEKELQLRLLVKRNGSLISEKSYDLQLQKAQTRLKVKEYLQDIGYGKIHPEQPVNWELCAELWDLGAKTQVVSCQPLVLLPVLPPHLVYPFDEDELLTPLPTFSWTAPGPIRSAQPIYYTLKVVELMGYYPAKVAISTLPAFYRQEGLREQVHPYTGRGQSFQVGKVYAWQIYASTGSGRDLGQSEVWTFSLAGPKEEEEDNRPFVELKQKYDAGYYPAYGKVKFRFDCRYGEKGPVYTITNQRGDPLKVSRDRLEKKGDNLFVLTIPPGSGFIEGEYYFMEVEDGKGTKSKLMFRYFYGK